MGGTLAWPRTWRARAAATPSNLLSDVSIKFYFSKLDHRLLIQPTLPGGCIRDLALIFERSASSPLEKKILCWILKTLVSISILQICGNKVELEERYKEIALFKRFDQLPKFKTGDWFNRVSSLEFAPEMVLMETNGILNTVLFSYESKNCIFEVATMLPKMISNNANILHLQVYLPILRHLAIRWIDLIIWLPKSRGLHLKILK